VKLTVIGCSPAWPNPGSAQSGYLVEADGRLLLDCGPGVLARLREREQWPNVDAIVLTHFHLDHWGDLVPWTFGAVFGATDVDARPELWLPPGGNGTLRSYGAQLAFGDLVDDVFDVREYADDETFTAVGVEIRPIRVPHYDILTFGLRVAAHGRVLAYSGDSAPSDALVEVARDADLFLCEATLADDGEREPRGHLTAAEATAAAAAAGAKRLLVVHRPHELALDDSVERARDGWSATV
jgi:ribonuclease BN (tRNA processing enzyme)